MNELIAQSNNYRTATPHDVVLNGECAFTFHTPYSSEQGICVSLSSFMGTVQELSLNASSDAAKGLFVRIVKKRIPKVAAAAAADAEEEMSDAPTKLGVGVEGGFAGEDDLYETISQYSLVALGRTAGGTAPPQVLEEIVLTDETRTNLPEPLIKSIDSIIHHAGLAVQQDLKVWELDDEPKPISKYAASLEFVDNGITISPSPSDWKCESSGAVDNLWLNLSDGYIGGGRRNWDGSGGSNGALDHYKEDGNQGYPLVVKLGTITATTGDCYSYAPDEDGPVTVPNLAELLEKRGIKVAAMQKTVKSTAELEVELNATYAFDAITEAGANLVPVTGPSLQGLQNLGNSCYMNSVVQLLLSGTVKELAERYGGAQGASVLQSKGFAGKSPDDATTNLLIQTTKLALALTTGAYAAPEPDDKEENASSDPKYRLQPRMFKHAVAGDHVDFSTGQQQDAAQFLQYMLEKLDRAERGEGKEGSKLASHFFSFRTTDRLVCMTDSKVKYKDSAVETMLSLPIPMHKATVVEEEPDSKRLKADSETTVATMDEDRKPVPTISLQTCLDEWASETTLDDYRWPHLGNSLATATSESRLSNFPPYLLLQMQRYTLGADWTPQKLEVNLAVPPELNLSQFKGKGSQEGEMLVPDEPAGDAASPAAAAPQIDEGALAQLMDMGFTFNGCKRALLAVGGSDVQAAMNWVFEHNMDPDFNDPVPDEAPAPATGGVDGVSEIVVSELVANLGCFTADHVRAALKHVDGAADRAADWLFSHMDNLDASIAELNNKAADSLAPSTPVELDDGPGHKYELVGMVSHIGKHTGSGHYVAHLKRDENKWVIFNDEKVALSESPPFEHAYLYLYKRS